MRRTLLVNDFTNIYGTYQKNCLLHKHLRAHKLTYSNRQAWNKLNTEIEMRVTETFGIHK